MVRGHLRVSQSLVRTKRRRRTFGDRGHPVLSHGCPQDPDLRDVEYRPDPAGHSLPSTTWALDLEPHLCSESPLLSTYNLHRLTDRIFHLVALYPFTE